MNDYECRRGVLHLIKMAFNAGDVERAEAEELMDWVRLAARAVELERERHPVAKKVEPELEGKAIVFLEQQPAQKIAEYFGNPNPEPVVIDMRYSDQIHTLDCKARYAEWSRLVAESKHGGLFVCRCERRKR